MLEIKDKKFIKITGGGGSAIYPKTIISSIDAVEALEFNITFDKDSYKSYRTTDGGFMKSYFYTVMCTILFTNGKSIETLVYKNTLKSPYEEGGPFGKTVTEKFDKLISHYQEEFTEAKTSFQNAVRDESFQLLLTNKIIQNNVK